eukprot:6919284-Prymnesium_polylepis.1
MSSVERASTAAAAMLCLVVRSATNESTRAASGRRRWSASLAALPQISVRCSGVRAWAAHATD